MLNAGRVVSKAQIPEHVWAYDFGCDGNVVETFISYLRNKVDMKEPPLIQTVRGFGYTFDRDVRRADVAESLAGGDTEGARDRSQ